MKIKLTIAFVMFCLGICVPNVVEAQDTSLIKAMIVDDMVLLNKVYDSKIISNQPRKTSIIYGDKVVDSFYSIPSEKLLESSSSVTIVELKKLCFDLFAVKIRFNVVFVDVDSRDFEFEYLLFQANLSENKYYRIDGFLVNDIFVLEKNDIESIGIFYDKCKKIPKYYSSRNRMNKFRTRFKSTVMDKLNLRSKRFDTAPIFNSNSFGFSQVTDIRW